MFVLFGTVVGIVGAVLGIGLGWLIIENINAIEQAIASAFGGIAAAAIGSLIPAVAAARVKPVETLQYE
jgi:ABC-type lipoprotein release transport system permease subunit